MIFFHLSPLKVMWCDILKNNYQIVVKYGIICMKYGDRI